MVCIRLPYLVQPRGGRAARRRREGRRERPDVRHLGLSCWAVNYGLHLVFVITTVVLVVPNIGSS